MDSRTAPTQRRDAPAGGECLLVDLPDSVLQILWPPEAISEGLCVGSQFLKRALLAAPKL